MAKTTINVRQITLTGSAAAMGNLVANGSLSDDAVFMLQQGSSAAQLIRAKDMQEYFSHIDVDVKSDNNEYTLLFIDPDVQDGTTDGFTILRDSNGHSDLAFNPSTNLLGVSGSLSLKKDSTAINFGASGEVTLTHVANTGLLLNAARELQFRDSALKIHSSANGQLDIDADSEIELVAPTLDLDASTALNVSGAALTFLGGDYSLTGDGTFDVDVAGALTLDGGSITVGGDSDVAVDIDASTLTIDASSTAALRAAGALTISGSALDIDAAGGAANIDATGAISLDAGAASNFTVSSGDLSLIADADNGKVTIRSDVTGSAVAIHLDGNAGAGAIVDIDGGDVDIDATDAVTIDGATISLDSTSSSNISMAASTSGTQTLTIAASNSGGGAAVVDIDAGQLDIDASDWVKIDAADEIEVTTTSADGHITLHSAHTAGQAILIDANANSGSILDVDAGILTVDTQGAATHTIGGAFLLDGASTVGIQGAGTISLGTADSGVAVNIGHGTSEVTIGDNLTVTGDLTVNGTNTVVNSTVTTIDDPLIVLGKDNPGVAKDLGIIFEQSGSSSNTGFFYDSSATEFALKTGMTEDGTTSGNINASGSYAKVHMGALDADAASTIASLKVEDLTSGRVVLAGSGGEIEDNGNLTFDGSTLKVVGSISGSANVEMGGNLTVDGNTIIGDASSDTLSVLATATFTPTADFNAGLTVAAGQSVAGDAALTVTAAGQLNVDSTSGKVQISGSAGIQLESVADTTADIDADSFYYLDADGLVKRDVMSDVFQLAKGDGVQVSSAGLFSVDPVELVVMSGSSSSVSSGNSITIADNHSSAVLADSFEVYLNGMLLTRSGSISQFSSNAGDYSVSGTTVTLVDALDSDDVLTVRYIKK